MLPISTFLLTSLHPYPSLPDKSRHLITARSSAPKTLVWNSQAKHLFFCQQWHLHKLCDVVIIISSIIIITTHNNNNNTFYLTPAFTVHKVCVCVCVCVCASLLAALPLAGLLLARSNSLSQTLLLVYPPESHFWGRGRCLSL